MKNKKLKTLLISLIVPVLVLTSVQSVFAHVSVAPKEVGAASFQTFNVGVPNERDSATVGVRLVIPEGLGHVRPNVKPGWEIEITTEGEGEEAVVTEIEWTGGEIPSGQRDDFFFGAQAPGEETTIAWKAYQTYADGSIVSWDVIDGKDQPTDEEGKPDFSEFGPASSTEVINDLVDDSENDSIDSEGEDLPITLSIIAIVLGGGALYLQFRNKK